MLYSSLFHVFSRHLQPVNRFEDRYVLNDIWCSFSFIWSWHYILKQQLSVLTLKYSDYSFIQSLQPWQLDLVQFISNCIWIGGCIVENQNYVSILLLLYEPAHDEFELTLPPWFLRSFTLLVWQSKWRLLRWVWSKSFLKHLGDKFVQITIGSVTFNPSAATIKAAAKRCFDFLPPLLFFLFFQQDPYQVAPWKTVQVYSFSTDTLSHTYQSTQAAVQSLILWPFEVCHMQVSLIYMKDSTFQASRSRLKSIRII